MSSTQIEMVQRPMRVRRRMPSCRCSARSSSPSFLAAQTNIAKTTPALSSATTESKTPSATVTGRIVPGLALPRTSWPRVQSVKVDQDAFSGRSRHENGLIWPLATDQEADALLSGQCQEVAVLRGFPACDFGSGGLGTFGFGLAEPSWFGSPARHSRLDRLLTRKEDDLLPPSSIGQANRR
jgi:hypothetical protein